LLGRVAAVDLMCKGKQTSYMALHADARCKAPPPHVSTGTDLWAGQRVEVSLQIGADKDSRRLVPVSSSRCRPPAGSPILRHWSERAQARQGARSGVARALHASGGGTRLGSNRSLGKRRSGAPAGCHVATSREVVSRAHRVNVSVCLGAVADPDRTGPAGLFIIPRGCKSEPCSDRPCQTFRELRHKELWASGISSNVWSLNIRPVAFLFAPPHCLKKNAVPAARHKASISSTHSRSIGRERGPLSPPTMAQWTFDKSASATEPISGSNDMNRIAAGTRRS
jgi:hypothetical protein